MAKIKWNKSKKSYESNFTAGGRRIRELLSPNALKANELLKDLIALNRSKKTGIQPKAVSWFFFKQQCLDWYKENRKAQTLYTIQSSLDTVEHYGRPLRSILDMTPTYMEDFLKKWVEAGFDKRTGLSHLRRVKTAIKWAEKRSLMPMQNWGLVEMPAYAPRVEYFTYAELDEVMDACQGHWKTAAILMAYAGLRSGEVRHLDWKDIDFKTRVIHIRAKWVVDSEGQKVWWEPKESEPGKPRNRVVDMGDRLEAFLKALPSRQGFVLGGDLIKRDTYRLYFGRVSKKVKFKVYAHKFRHTYASFMCTAGVDVDRLKVLMGHRDSRSTEIYRHLMPHARREAVDQMEKSLPPIASRFEVLDAKAS